MSAPTRSRPPARSCPPAGVLVVCLVALALVPGCLFVGGSGSIGPHLPAADLGRIVPGRTTKAEVLALLGPPDEHRRPEAVAAMSDDELRIAGALSFAHRAENVLTWQRDDLQARGTILLLLNVVTVDTRSERVVIFFDAFDVVREVTTSQSLRESR
ncbi:MAG: hypothetical protein ACT4PU_11875 [Planctomycetota bacterium]